MTESATILIPDISGFTTFVARTELEHSAHIVTELLDTACVNHRSAGRCAQKIDHVLTMWPLR